VLALILWLALTPSQWHEDVDVFARELPKRHLNAFHHMTREQFDAAVNALRLRAMTANDDEMYVGLLQITAMVGDAHTFVGGSPNRRKIPIIAGQFGSDWRVVRATDASKALLGGRLVRIDDAPIDDVVQKLRTILSQDETDEYVRSSLTGWVVDTEALHGLGIIDDPRRVRVTVERDGTEQTLTLDTVPVSDELPLKVASGPVPLFRQNPEETFMVAWLEQARTVYVNFRTYKDLKSKAKDLWALVDSKPVEKIVIDLRQNGGGDYKVGHRDLVSELAKRPKLKAYVITGNRTFSAAMNNAVQFRDEAHATLVGQPIGERPNSYQERRSFRLPNSGLEVSVSTQFYKFVSDDSPNQVVPDKRIETTWDDFLAGRDPMMDWILSQK
jgi:hypothetical protein